MKFFDKNYSNAYFGIDAASAAITGLAPYRASGGIGEVGAGVSARYMFTKNWGLTAQASYTRLLGDAAKSPIVKQQGSANQFAGGLGVVYSF